MRMGCSLFVLELTYLVYVLVHNVGGKPSMCIFVLELTYGVYVLVQNVGGKPSMRIPFASDATSDATDALSRTGV